MKSLQACFTAEAVSNADFETRIGKAFSLKIYSLKTLQ